MEGTITISLSEYNELLRIIKIQAKQIEFLEKEIKLLRNGRKSDTSSTPGSQDYTCSNKSKKHKKIIAFIRRLIKNRDSIFTFLYYAGVPPDNKGSERAIRNAKVKMKISNQFKSPEFANHYAVIRRVDTTIKNSKKVFEAL